jgi:hypothetical protein
MGAGVAVAANDGAPRQAQSQLGPNDVDDALPRLVDIEQLDAAGGGLNPKRRQQLLPDLAGAGPAMRRGDGMVRGRKGQFRTVNFQSTPLEVKQPARAAEIVQQMAVDMKEIGILADASNHMLFPDLGQHRTARLSQGSPPFGFLRPAA